ncbi:MAG: hypothetical protein KGI06_05185 [Candidatus Micrarchaeota archaeon]|nr:hypothetical protein [Candidatus Micrarchaeota archaeon]
MLDNFISNIKNGFNIANTTRRIVFRDKQLFAYPIASTVISIVVAVLIFAAAFGIYVFGHMQTLDSHVVGFMFFVVAVIAYFIIFFIGTYFTMAMLIAFREFSKGKRITMGQALGMTSQYKKLILEWSAFYIIIATIIHVVEGLIRGALSRYGFTGNIISSFITGGANLAFAGAVAFSLPVILDNRTGPIETIKSSTGFILKNFGDTFGGLVFAEIFQIALTLLGLVVIFLAFLALPSILLAIALFSIGMVLIVAGLLMRYVLFNCFKLIVYDYKTKKVLPKGFDAKLIESSIKKKKKSPGGRINFNPFLKMS